MAFRLDDVRDFKKTDAQIEIIKTSLENDVPLTIGIVANDFGEEPENSMTLNITPMILC